MKSPKTKPEAQFRPDELKLLRKLDTPAKIQDFINSIPINFEIKGDTLRSPLYVLRENKAHCFEGALLAAYILSLHGHKPLIMHLKASKNDQDHVVALFKANGRWGAISKTNHAVLRYREPVYKTLRELALSYFHEYFLDDGIKTLRSYSAPLNLSSFERGWERMRGNLWGIDRELDRAKHFAIADSKTVANFRKADKVEREAGKIVEWR